MPDKQPSPAKAELNAVTGIGSGAWLGSNGWNGREADVMPWPNRDGYWLLRTDQASQIKGPNGFVEIVSHENFGKTWRWCYWLPTKKHKSPPRCGCPLEAMNGCEWIGPLLPNVPN
jgi:hypothetical protein